MTKLDLYNGALSLIGERPLLTETEDRPVRRTLDIAFNGGAPAFCFEVVRPRFALAIAKLEAPTPITDYGLSNAFAVPVDYAGFFALYADEHLEQPIYRYVIDRRAINTAEAAPVYLRYISDSTPIDKWTPSFARVVEAYLAKQVCQRIAPDKLPGIEELFRTYAEAAGSMEGVKEMQPLPQRPTYTLDGITLGVYNGALTLLGLPEIRSIDDGSPMRLALDAVMNSGAEEFCLLRTRPKFATRTARLTEPTLGMDSLYNNVFTLPADYIDLIEPYSDITLDEPIHRYILEGREIGVEAQEQIWVRYLTNEALTDSWGANFRAALSAYLAKEVAPRFAAERTTELEELFEKRVAITMQNEGVKERPFRPAPTLGPLTDDWRHVYNAALSIVGEPKILSDFDDSERRSVLDTAIESGALNYCLSVVKPRFATKLVRLNTPQAGTQHGYENVFELPDDYVTMISVFHDSELDEPIHRYFLEDGLIATESPEIYLRYITDTVPPAQWSTEFTRAMAAYLAKEAAPQLLTRESWEARQAELRRISAEYEQRVQFAAQQEGFSEPPQRSRPGASQLTPEWIAIYNRALQILRLPPVLSEDDDSDRRAALDEAVNSGTVSYLISRHPWDFAYKTIKLESNPSYEAGFGFQHVFDLPPDFERVDQVSAGESFSQPVRYYREGDRLLSDVAELYVRYISSDYAADPGLWPQYFRDLVAAELARRCGRLPGADLENAEWAYREINHGAKAVDVQRNPPQKIALGSWSRARGAGRRNRYLGRP